MFFAYAFICLMTLISVMSKHGCFCQLFLFCIPNSFLMIPCKLHCDTGRLWASDVSVKHIDGADNAADSPRGDQAVNWL